MGTLTERPRRRAPRGAACDEPPRLWGEETTAPPVTASAARERAAVGPTLDDLVSGAWARLSGTQATACPVCASAMAPRWSAGSGVVGGRCGGCGSTLE